MTIPTDLLTDLVPLLAETDAVHVPIRRYTGALGHRALELRYEFHHRGGLPYSPATASDDPGRKAAERQASEWEAAGLVQCVRRRGRRALWRLTDQGDWAMRSFSWPTLTRGTAGREEMIVAMFCIHRNEAAGYVNQGIVPETALSGVKWGSPSAADAIQTVEDCLLPALCRNLVVSNSDIDGRVGYSLTDTGRAWLASLPAPPSDLPEYSSTEAHRYTDLFVDALVRLDSEPPRGPAVWIRASAGLWPAGEPVGPPILTRSGKPRTLADYLRRAKVSA